MIPSIYRTAYMTACIALYRNLSLDFSIPHGLTCFDVFDFFFFSVAMKIESQRLLIVHVITPQQQQTLYRLALSALDCEWKYPSNYRGVEYQDETKCRGRASTVS